MRLLTCVTENFKKLGSFTAEFTQGLNVVAGDNAKGKSTLLQAIQVALFGPTVVPGKKENIPTWGQKTWKVTLTFQLHADEIYSCVRTDKTAKLTRTNADGSVDLVANGSTPVTAEMESLLGLSAKDWDLFVQSKQHSSAAILEFGAAALNRKVEEFAGVDLIDKVQAEAQRQSTISTGKADALLVSDEAMEEAREMAKAAADASLQAGSGLATAVSNSESQGEFDLEKPAAAFALREKIAVVVSLSNRITVAENNVKHANSRADEAAARTMGLVKQDGAAILADMEGMKTSGTTLAATEKALNDELAVAKRLQLAADEADLALDTCQVEHNANWKDFEPDDSEIEIALLDRTIQTSQDDLAARLEEVGKAKGSYDNLLMLSDGAVCPTCLRAKEDHDPEKLKAEAEEARTYWEGRKASVAQLQTDIAAMKEDRKGRADTLARYEASIVKLDNAINADKAAKEAVKPARALGIIEDELSGVAGQLSESRTSYAEMQAKLKGITEANSTYDREHAALAAAGVTVDETKATLQALNDELEALPEPPTEADVKAAEAAETAYQAAHSEWKERKQVLESAVTLAKQEVKHATSLLDAANEKLEQLQKNATAAVEHVALAKKYQRLVQFLRDRRQQYLKEVWDTVMGVGSKLVRTASKDLITQISNDEGDFYYMEEGISAPTASASGAQKAMIGVSLRVGLARALYGKDSLLIFDEPTADCREHNAASLAAMIAGSAKQVLLITHRETDQALAENIVNVGE
ncbi:DNA repair exonuclease [Pseudomonas phage Lana]|uniref:Plectin 1 isoform 8 n=1 Tax=Pseudomonas phage Lana TaxID=2530172 RepID=A0A481W622_9CAUD|nr:DNA repair exonuclease [Pseudomonas phage Lana]QBJ04544.1 plectin 1 isoform 8 [Pseudomonas phage Lana]